MLKAPYGYSEATIMGPQTMFGAAQDLWCVMTTHYQ